MRRTAIALTLASVFVAVPAGARAAVHQIPLPGTLLPAIAFGGGRALWATVAGKGPVQVFSRASGDPAARLETRIARSDAAHSPNVFVSLAASDQATPGSIALAGTTLAWSAPYPPVID